LNSWSLHLRHAFLEAWFLVIEVLDTYGDLFLCVYGALLYNHKISKGQKIDKLGISLSRSAQMT